MDHKIILLKDKDSGLYVGSHNATHCQLQERKHAVRFPDKFLAVRSINLMKDLPLDFEIVCEDPVLDDILI